MIERSVDLALPRNEVVEICRTLGIATYFTESMSAGFTRVYCKSRHGAHEIRREYGEFVVH